MDQKGKITFFFEDIEKFDFDHIKHRKWIYRIIDSEMCIPGVLNFIYSNDKHVYKLNMDYLKHDTYTDIITFSYSGDYQGHISGDIFISIDRVRENANTNNASFSTELRRIIAHGILHLIGFNDNTPNEKKQMTMKENYYLDLF